MERYSPQDIESKWQKKWEEGKVYKTEADASRPKYYALEMFPYPSGNLHMGHVRNYAIGDVMARYKTMEGFNVLHPMGFDSFGMPAENAAIKHGVKPADWTYSNIENMEKQQKKLGLSYDWDREVKTCDPSYYKWTQWLFELFYKRGLAYKKKASVNWCDTCGTVLANEQVIDGKCWRCDHEVHKKDLSQWFLKITDYADVLLKDLDKLKGWPERVKTMQDNWIGRSEGLEFNLEAPELGTSIAAYTTRPDTVYGITFLALAAEHPLVDKICENNPKAEAIQAFVKRTRNQSEIERTSSESEKEGIFTGAYCINPFNGNKVQIWVTNYVLADTARLFILFAAPVDRDLEWSDKGVEGSYRFLNRVWRILGHFEDAIKAGKPDYDVTKLTKDEKELRRILHVTIRKVTEDVRDRFMFNTAVSSIMELVNAFYAFQDKEMNAGLAREVAENLIKLLAPFAPHITEELWSRLFEGQGSVHQQKWPAFDEEATKLAEIEIVLQINGKVRDKLMIPADTDREGMKKIAMELPRTQELTAGKTIVKVICVPKKLVNIVVKG